MKKIPTLYSRDFDGNPKHVIRDVTVGCEWVIAGEGTATRKWDGTCVKLDEAGLWWARREVKPGKTAPPAFVAEQTDETTGKTVGWEPIAQSPFAKFHAEAVAADGEANPPGSYELVGPKINGNPEALPSHELIAHATAAELDAPRDFDGLAAWLADCPFEGIVWHHPDGRMVKLKRRDFPGPND